MCEKEISVPKSMGQGVVGLGLLLLSPPLSPSSSIDPLETLCTELGGLTLDQNPNPTGWEDDERSEKDLPTQYVEGLDENIERVNYPQRPGAIDCAFYMRNGTCQFGMNCWFNHPLNRRKRNKVKAKKSSEQIPKVTKGKEKKCSVEQVGKAEEKKDFKDQMKETYLGKAGKAESKKDFKEQMIGTSSGKDVKTESKNDKGKQNKTVPGRMRQTELKNSMPGGNKFGKASKHVHLPEKTEPGPIKLNFLGLPLRPGERECTNYMRTGGCQFATNCRFHHPDPVAVAGQDTPEYQNHASHQEHAFEASTLPMPAWPLPMAPPVPVPFFQAPPPYGPGFYPLPPQGFYPNPEWSGYQVPMAPWLPQQMNAGNPSASATQMSTTTVPSHQRPPSRPPCHNFIKNGDCKFKSACRYHHPKTAPKANP